MPCTLAQSLQRKQRNLSRRAKLCAATILLVDATVSGTLTVSLVDVKALELWQIHGASQVKHSVKWVQPQQQRSPGTHPHTEAEVMPAKF